MTHLHSVPWEGKMLVYTELTFLFIFVLLIKVSFHLHREENSEAYKTWKHHHQHFPLLAFPNQTFCLNPLFQYTWLYQDAIFLKILNERTSKPLWVSNEAIHVKHLSGYQAQLPSLTPENGPVRMVNIKNVQITNAGENVEKREPSCTVGGNVNWYSHYGEQYGGSLKN